jgi:alpha-L-fucosidase
MKRIGSLSVFAIAMTGLVQAQERTAWFREAKFGMFIHWGPSAIPAGEWDGKKVSGPGEWIMKSAKIPVADNADEWVQLAKDAGMGYMVITSKHHDGFAMFHSRVSKFNVVDATPFGRDVVRELSEACRRQGLRFGCYYSQSQDWHHPGGAVRGVSWDPAQQGDYDQYLNTIALPQVKEVLTGYGPIALIWFDTPVNMTEARGKPFREAIRTLQPACLINSRILMSGATVKKLTPDALAKLAGTGYDYVSRADNEIPPVPMPGCWETPATLNDTWGYKKNDQKWKSPETLLYKLVDIVSKGGNYLLNVGPDATGFIPQESQNILRQVGAWLKVNGEAIYNAGPTPFGQEFGGTVEDKDEYGRQVMVSALRAWRCTTQPGKLYFHIFEWPASGRFEVAGMNGKAVRAHLLADTARAARKVTQTGDQLAVELPAQAPGALPAVLCVELSRD